MNFIKFVSIKIDHSIKLVELRLMAAEIGLGTCSNEMNKTEIIDMLKEIQNEMRKFILESIGEKTNSIAI